MEPPPRSYLLPGSVAVVADSGALSGPGACSDEKRIFYMSREFTDHCLEIVDQTIEGIGARVRRVLWTDEPSDRQHGV